MDCIQFYLNELANFIINFNGIEIETNWQRWVLPVIEFQLMDFELKNGNAATKWIEFNLNWMISDELAHLIINLNGIELATLDGARNWIPANCLNCYEIKLNEIGNAELNASSSDSAESFPIH